MSADKSIVTQGGERGGAIQLQVSKVVLPESCLARLGEPDDVSAGSFSDSDRNASIRISVFNLVSPIAILRASNRIIDGERWA